jgi:hypothetical protein
MNDPKDKVKVRCRKCGKGFWLDKSICEWAAELGVWDDENPWCPECNIERVRQRWKENN